MASLCCRTCYPRRRWRGCSIKAVRKRNKVLRLPVKPPTDFLAVLLRGSWRIRRDQRVSDDVHCYKYGAPANVPPSLFYILLLLNTYPLLSPPCLLKELTFGLYSLRRSYYIICCLSPYPQFLARASYKLPITSKCLPKTSTTL